jgi:hypothetical protein
MQKDIKVAGGLTGATVAATILAALSLYVFAVVDVDDCDGECE